MNAKKKVEERAKKLWCELPDFMDHNAEDGLGMIQQALKEAYEEGFVKALESEEVMNVRAGAYMGGFKDVVKDFDDLLKRTKEGK